MFADFKSSLTLKICRKLRKPNRKSFRCRFVARIEYKIFRHCECDSTKQSTNQTKWITKETALRLFCHDFVTQNLAMTGIRFVIARQWQRHNEAIQSYRHTEGFSPKYPIKKIKSARSANPCKSFCYFFAFAKSRILSTSSLRGSGNATTKQSIKIKSTRQSKIFTKYFKKILTLYIYFYIFMLQCVLLF